MPRYLFGPFSLDPETRVLLRNGEPIPMAGKNLDMLVVLVQNRGRLVDKDELLSRVWPGTIVEEANLSQSIFTVRKILGDTPKDRRYIATVAGRGYQFVAPITELTSETPPIAEAVSEAPQKPASDSVVAGGMFKRHKKVAISLITVVAAGAGGLWFVLHRPAKAPAELVERRLTFNSSANPIASAAISPDGKYLAYSDAAGIHLRLLSTGEERLIPTPAVRGALSYIDSWFPNGTELLAHSEEAGGRQSMWAVSVMGQSSRELRSDASGWEVSPDGKRIAFSPSRTASDTREIWVMDSQGDNPRKILGGAAGEFLWSVHWSPDGQRLVYMRAGPTFRRMETCDLKGANRAVVVAAEVRSICWLPDRRIVYSQGEAHDVDANLWQIGVDTHTGMPRGKPKRFTRWAGSDLQGMSASADGKRLVLRKETYQDQLYIGELAAGGTRLSPPRRLTHDEASNYGMAWTADSKAVLFSSDRNGKWSVFKQDIGQDTPVPLVEGREKLYLPRLSPDGTWVLYPETSLIAAKRSPQYRMMRVPVNGGLPRLVYETKGALWEDHQCARAPANLCITMELSLDEKRLTVTALDPLKGEGKLLRTIEKNIGENFNHALSPDGSTLALAKEESAEIHIRLLSLTGGSDREIRVKGWSNIASMEWSADGKGLYCGSESSSGGALLYVDPKGAAQVLWQSGQPGEGPFLAGSPSPDGRYLALWGPVHNSTAWIVEGF
jgi:DNA-binding winged helix-turn-helix (wHTH) protein/Tol biopolymer transport system component